MDKKMKKMIFFQQQELDAVIMYRALANRMKNDRDKVLLQELAACEAKHATLLKQITGASLKPRALLKSIVMCAYSLLGKKALFKIMSTVETAAYKTYEPFFVEFPSTVEIANDEVDHGEKLMNATK